MGMINDAWQNIRDVFESEPGYDKKKGTKQRDPFARQEVRAPKEFSHSELYEIYRGSELGGKLVDDLAEDMVREWFTIETESSSLPDDVQGKLSDLDAKTKIQDMLKWDLVFGDGYNSIGIKGSPKPSKPVKSVKDISYLHSFSPRKVSNQVTNEDVMDEEYGDFKNYEISVPDGSGMTKEVNVHPNRILHSQMRPRLDSQWGDSIYTRMQQLLIVFDNTVWTVGQMMFQMVLKTLKTNLKEKSADEIAEIADEVEDEVNSLSLWLLHKDENAEEELDMPSSTMNMSGFDEIIEFMKDMAAVATRRPKSIVFGAQSGTLSASDVDSLNYYQRVNSLQESHLRPNVEQLVDYVVQSLSDYSDPDYHVRFNDLYTYDDQTKAEIRLTRAKAYDLEVKNDILSAQEIREKEYNKDSIDIGTPQEVQN